MTEYLTVSTRIRIESGPTSIGDRDMPEELMFSLGAELVQEIGNNFSQWQCKECPRIVLNKLAKLGYDVVAMTGVGQTCIWTLRKQSKLRNKND